MMFREASRQLAKNARMAHISAAPPRQKSILQGIFGGSKYDETDLSIPFGPQSFPQTSTPEAKTAQVTTLANGTRVVSYNADKPSAHLGVHIDAGSRYEDGSNHGISHFLQHHAFKSTSNRSAFRFVRETDAKGIAYGVSTTKEHTSYCADSLRDAAPYALGSIADVLVNSEFVRHELLASKDLYSELYSEPAAETPDIVEGLHAAAFKNNTYGNPLLATKAGLEAFTTDSLKQHTGAFWTADRVVVSAVGVAHSELVDMTSELLSGLPASTAVNKSKAVYTGGQTLLPSDGNMVNVSLGFEAPDWKADNVVSVLVLQTLLGGGNTFSAGGPGKGMYTRLYRNVLCRPWVLSAKCDAHLYNDAGLFALSGTTEASQAESLVAVLIEELQSLTGSYSDAEVSRAKNMLKGQVLFALEQRQVQQQDMAQQLMTYDRVRSASEWVSLIEAVSASDLQAVAGTLLKTPLSFAASGNLKHVPDLAAIARHF
jgi:processing peptidase subunit alpha